MNSLYTDFLNQITHNTKLQGSTELISKIIQSNSSNSNMIKSIFENFFIDKIYISQIIIFIKHTISFVLLFVIINTLINIFDNAKFLFVLKYIVLVITTINLVPNVYSMFALFIDNTKTLSTFLGILFPLVGTLSAIGGNVTLASTSNYALSIFLSCMQVLTSKIIPVIISIFISLSITDVLSGEGKLEKLSLLIKNLFFGCFSFLSAIFIIIVAYCCTTASNVDSVSAKTIKLLIGKAVPIIGGTISEAIKFSASGIISIKNSIGSFSMIFIICLFLPTIIILWLFGGVLALIIFICDYLSINGVKSLICHIKYCSDFLLAAIALIVTSALINIGIFLTRMPAITI